MKNEVIFVLIIIGIIWGIYRWLKTKNERLVYAIGLGGSVLLHNYPLWLPIEFTLAFWGFFSFAVLLYKIMYKKIDKNLIVFAFVFLTFGIIFLLQGLLSPMHERKVDVQKLSSSYKT